MNLNNKHDFFNFLNSELNNHEEFVALGLKGTARKAGCSPDYFRKIIKKHTGMSWTDFYKYRMEEAIRDIVNESPYITVEELIHRINVSKSKFYRLIKEIFDVNSIGSLVELIKVE